MRGTSRMASAIGISLAILTVSCSPNRPTDMEESNSVVGERISCGTLWYRDANGSCSPAVSTGYTDTCAATIAGFEGDVGRRVASYESFSAGFIVTFLDGYKVPLWSTRIDCEDPPIDPLKGWRAPPGEGGGIGVAPTPINNDHSSTPSTADGDEDSERSPSGPQGEPLVVPVGQGAEPWLRELRERQEGFCGEHPVVSRTSSLEGAFEYLEVCSWATSNDIIQRRVSDGRLREVGDGNGVKVIRTGPWRGFLLASRHRYYKGGGSYDATYVIRPDGKEMFEIEGSRVSQSAVTSWLRSHGWTAD